MILVQGTFAEIIIPYSASLSRTMFDIANELAIVFLPMLVIFVQCFLEARSQGQDEGQPGILIIKNLEVKFYSMVVVLVICVIPSQGTQQVSNKTYVCGYSQTSSAMGDIYKARPVLNDTRTWLATRDVELPLLLGLFNNLSVGSSEALSSQLDCNKDQATILSEMNKDYIQLNDEPLIGNIKHFAKQCYQPALERIAEVTVDGSSTIAFPYDDESNVFWGVNLNKAYVSNHSGSVPAPMPLYIRIKNEEYVAPIQSYYYPANYSSGRSSTPYDYTQKYKTDELTVRCDSAAQDLRVLIATRLQQIMPERIELEFKSASLVPKDKNGALYNVTEQDVINRFTQQAFVDAYTGKRTIYQATPAQAEIENESPIIKSLKYFWNRVTGAVDDPTGLGTDMVAAIGLAMENPFKSAERVNLYGMLPLFVTIIMGAVLIASPMLIILSGYKWEMVFNIGFIFFYLAMCHFWLNVSFLATNIVWLIADSFYGGTEILTNSYLSLHYIGYSMPFIVLLVWTAGCTMAGMKLAPFLVGLFTGAALAAAKAGKDVSNKAANPRVSGKGGGDKSQF
ncbi:conjugal transfer protein TraG N-terminal domain-containing protein [Vibrio sp. THAF190c]|uniref:conjugal transfer protein TraG N-terminal domain-containing protein n=1 Tax=Vibrio sp. THAF190c TaxID=2587865 RepID=UPI001268C476|nr:conjugal transfer protein TraG N-terminal domain-containing protein [Vibrio sp. THAF190c]QFT13377.1 hypothetical protein FIV04_25840 [Vibrio sp. THAF190c]